MFSFGNGFQEVSKHKLVGIKTFYLRAACFSRAAFPAPASEACGKGQ